MGIQCKMPFAGASAPPSSYQGELQCPNSLQFFLPELSVFDMLINDESEVGSERSLVHEAHVAFSVEGLGKIRTETPLYSPKQEGRISSDDCSLPWNFSRQLNSLKDMDVPLGGNPLQFSVDITYSHGNWKPNLSTSDDMQLDSHYRNSKCSFGDTDISYNIGREDIWDAKVSYLDDGFPHEREDDISWKYWPHKIDGNSGDFLDYENGEMPDNAFEGHHMLRKRDVKATNLNSLDSWDDCITQPGWPFFETEDAKDSLSLLRTPVKSKATKRASYCLQGEIELSQKWLLEEECNSVNIDLGFSSSHCTSQANLPSVEFQLWAEDPIGAFPVPELNLDVTSEKFAFCQPLNHTNSSDSSVLWINQACLISRYECDVEIPLPCQSGTEQKLEKVARKGKETFDYALPWTLLSSSTT
ncbi:hypothetical protein EPI10_000959 [Gossypium australe]|uniref:Uncharacterized protein n=1 Tax=Gossypium australe TaxID=47621 RepID=A0A5B6V9F6_9ROSI|nr:hypothetical protein EPI10_000959 [Gossypium australe]